MWLTRRPHGVAIRQVPEGYWSLPAEHLLQRLETAPLGLTSVKARRRLGLWGPSDLKPRRRSGSLILFLSQFRSPITLILLFAAGLSFFLRDPTDAGIILAIVLASSLLGFWQERGAAHALESLLAIVSRLVHRLSSLYAGRESAGVWSSGCRLSCDPRVDRSGLSFRRRGDEACVLQENEVLTICVSLCVEGGS
jgi:magnesium-transporting ATPase (P-type)